MARVAGPVAFRTLRAQSAEDHGAGMTLLLWLWLAVFAIIASYIYYYVNYDNIEQCVVSLFAPLGIKAYPQAAAMFWKLLASITGIALAAVAFNWILLSALTAWQRRHVLRLLNTTDLLCVYAMDDRTGVSDPAPPRTWQRFVRRKPYNLGPGSPASGTLAEALTTLTLKFDSACHRIGQRGTPVLYSLPYWLATLAAVAILSPMFLRVALADPNFIDGNSAQSMVAFLRAFLVLWLPFTIACQLGVAVDMSMRYGKRIGIRQALMLYLGPEQAPAVKSGQPAVT